MNIKNYLKPPSLIIFLGMAFLSSEFSVSFANTDQQDASSEFAKGATRLNCRIACSGGWGSSRKPAKDLYEKQQWEDLALLVSRIGYDTDLAYFYLGRAAEGVGNKIAARTYYELAISNPHKCTGALFDNCDGFRFPGDTNERLNSIISELSKDAPVDKKSNSHVVESPIKESSANPVSNEFDAHKFSKGTVETKGSSAQTPTNNLNLNEAPFGLTWGLPEDKVRSLKVNLVKNSTSGQISIYKSGSLPKNISFAKSYTLYFHPTHGLQKIVVLSKSISNDIHGQQGKDLYEKTKSQISAKYKLTPKSVEFSGVKSKKETEDFYGCLKSTECGVWNSLWKTPNVIGLELQGLNRGLGYLRLTYEGANWGQIMDDNKSPLTKDDASAL